MWQPIVIRLLSTIEKNDWTVSVASTTLKVEFAAEPGARSGVYRMKLAGFLLLLAGWGIVLTAVALLASALPRTCFVLAGMGVEMLGLILVVRSHLFLRGERG